MLLKELKDTLPNYVNGSSNGLTITPGSGGQDLSLLINKSIFDYNDKGELTLKVADPFEITSEGLKLKLKADERVGDHYVTLNDGELDVKISTDIF